MGLSRRLFIFLVSISIGNMLYGQDSIAKEISKLEFLNHIDQRNWRVKVPIWVPGFKGSFAYGGITTLPEDDLPEDGGGSGVIDHLQGELGVASYLMGDIEFKPKNWLFGVDGFHTTLVNNLKFQIIDKIEFLAAIDGTILRGLVGYKAFEKRNRDTHFRAQIYPYLGLRFIDLRIYSQNLDILDIDPSWLEPIIGLEIPVQHRRWFFLTKIDIGGFSINNHWSLNANVEASYRFSKLFALETGWNFLNFNYDQYFESDYLNLSIQLSGPVLGLEFHF